jgi:diguanylate cyclase (GGDEF)-like protein
VPSRKRSRSATLLAEISSFAGAESARTAERFLAVLRKHYRSLEIYLFETRGRRITSVESDVGIEKLVDEADVNTCLSERKPITTKSTRKPTLLVPVLVNNSAAMVVVARPSRRSRANINEFEALVYAYGNLLSLVQVSERDTLTGLFNRRMLDRCLPELISRLGSPRRRTSDPVSAHIGLMDLDRFKRVNDKFGHLYGDEVLLLFSVLMKQSFRSSDLLVRYGGEEFIVVLTDTTLANCEKVLERFRQKVETHWFPPVGRITISAGAVRVSNQALPSTILDQADQALYYAKRAGRNRVCIYEKLVKEGLIEVHEPPFGSEKLFEEKRKVPTRRKSAAASRRRAPARAG